MILTSEKAKKLIINSKNKDVGRWVNHSIKVGEAAFRIANKLNLDTDKAKAMGYIHDIGKSNNFGNHAVEGYNLLKDLGYDEEYANICMTHSFLNNDINCVAQGEPDKTSSHYIYKRDFIKKHELTTYDKIIQLCDLICTDEFLFLESRLIEMIIRSGAFPNTRYHVKQAIKLKIEIEEKMKCNLYSLFPELQKNFE